jgi:hypothetical protein
VSAALTINISDQIIRESTPMTYDAKYEISISQRILQFLGLTFSLVGFVSTNVEEKTYRGDVPMSP